MKPRDTMTEKKFNKKNPKKKYFFFRNIFFKWKRKTIISKKETVKLQKLKKNLFDQSSEKARG